MSQYLIDKLEEMKTYHSHSIRAAFTHSIPIPKCKKEITKTSLFHPSLDPGIHLILNTVKHALNLNFQPL